jgi:MATE family multidrug resistance protein
MMDKRRYWNVVMTSIGGFLGQNLMQVVDLLFCRPLGAEGSATVGSATAICAWFIIIGMGVLWSLEYFIPHSLGAKDEHRAQSFYYSGFVFAAVIGLLSGAGLCLAATLSPAFGIQPAIIPKLQSFCYIVSLSYLPIFVTGSGRVELQARGYPHEMTLAFVYGNLFNIFLNWLFVLGHWGLPALGTNGSALANVISRYAIMLYVLIRVHQIRKPVVRVVRPREVEYRKFIREIIDMGFPTSLHMIFEIGAFALVGTLAGQFSNAKIAAHTIEISIASVVFMVPLGMSSAAGLLMSEANGAGKPDQALALGRATIKLGMIFAVCMSLLMVAFRVEFIKAYTADADTIGVATGLLFIAAIFQFGDAMQVILAGCIRGFGETKIQAKMNGVGHWLIGLPVGLYLCYPHGLEVTGLWIGLCVGLFSVAGGLYWRWRILASKVRPATEAARTPH